MIIPVWRLCPNPGDLVNLRRLRMKVNPWVFFPAAFLITVFLAAGVSFPDQMRTGLGGLQHELTERFGWFYVVSVAFFLGFLVWLMFSRYGSLRLGQEDERPHYSRLTWFSMLFSAGMGIGLLFFGVYEPVHHFAQPPSGEGGTLHAAREAMRLSFFHWGLHGWAIYIVVGLSVAFFSYRYRLPLTIRTALFPLLGKHIHGPIGHLVDVLAVFGTLFGVATSLTFGVMQVNEGLAYLSIAERGTGTQLGLIVGITLIATVSVVTGVDRGIRRLSEFNVLAATLLLLFVLVAGPTSFLLSSFVEDVGRYLQGLPGLTLKTYAWAGEDEAVRKSWFSDWTLFYWGWWISWSPFVGMFIARVSRGRTIREFILGVLLVPATVTCFWISVFGNSALHLELTGVTDLVTVVIDQNEVPKALYLFLEQLPLPRITALFATFVIITFFITSSDSGSLVIDIITSDGDPHPPVGQRIFWAVLEGAVACVLLTLGASEALQAAVILTSLPFCIVMVLMCVGLVRALPAARRASSRHRLLKLQHVLTPDGDPAPNLTRPRRRTGSVSVASDS